MRVRPSSSLVIALAAIGLVSAVPTTVRADVVTSCGQLTHGASTLDADLDCTGFDGAAVTIARGSLALNGHTITGGSVGIKCEGKCGISGPGTVTGATIGISAYGKLKLSQVDVLDNVRLGVQCFVGCSATGPATISGTGEAGDVLGHGITSTGTLKLDGLTIADNDGVGAVARSYPSIRGKIQARNVTFTGNRIGLLARKAAKLTSCTVTNNAQFGVAIGEIAHPGLEETCQGASTVQLAASSATGNGTDAGCGTSLACADVATCKAPKLKSGTCDTSYVVASGIPGSDWDVCTAD